MKTIYILTNTRERQTVTSFSVRQSDALRIKNEINAGLASSGADMFATLELPDAIM